MTTAPTPTQLMAGFKSGFGEIIDLVTEANDKTGPWVTDRIKKMSRKAQDEIYERFNETFNDGLKDAAAGREFYESSLDFPALAQKTTQVADDIELVDKINKQFEENAPIKTIYGQYKQLSTSARKEIEKHLGTTADKAKPKELQNALLTVFNGMGRLESEAAKKQECTGFEKKLLYLAYTFRYDYEVLKQARGYLEIRGGEWSEERGNVDNLFNRLSPYAQLLIEQKLRAHCPGDFSASSPARDESIDKSIFYHIACHKSADYVKSTMLSLLKSFETNENSKSILKNVDTSKLGKMEKLLLDEYLGYPRLIAHGHLGSKFEPATHDFQDSVLNDHCKRTKEFLPPEHEDFANQEYELGELQSQFNKDRDIQILGRLPGYVTSPKNDKQGFIAKYAGMSNANKEDFAGYLKDKYEATLNSASPTQLWLCCKEIGPEIIRKLYLTKDLFTKYDFLGAVMFPSRSKTPPPSSSTSSTSSSAKPAPKAEPAKVEQIELTDEVVNRIVDLAVAYKIDLAVLKQAKQTNADFKTVFKNLSPYAQLLIELRTPEYSGLTAFDGVVSKCTNDPHTTKTVFLDLLLLFELNEEEQYIYTTQAIKLKPMERNLLFQYLRYPRYLANDSIRKNPDCTFEVFRKEISSKAREISPASSAMASDFRDLVRLVVVAITQAEKDMSASEDSQTYAKPELKKDWLLCNRNPSEPRTTLFRNAKFLDGVYASLPFPKAEPQTASATSVKVEPTKPVERAARTKTEDRFIAYAQAFKQDYSLLEQHKTCFKAPKPDKEELLKIYKGLSPYGQLLIMQRLIWNDPGPYNNLGDVEKGKMDAIVERYVDYDLRNALLLFLVSQDSKINTKEFVDFPSDLSKLGSMEKTLLRAYLDYPRELTLEYLKSGSKENFEEVLLLKFRENKHVSFDEFEATFASQLSENDRHFTNHKDYQLYQGLLTYLNQQDSPVHKKGFLNTYYNLSNRTRAAHDDILQREFKQTIGNDDSGATVEQLRVSLKLLELEIRKQVFPEYFIGNYRLFSRIDFLDRVIAPLFDA
jgi:hypothetical protein